MCNAVTERIERLEQKIIALEKNNDAQDERSNTLQLGILSLQRDMFLKQGRELLEADHIITYEEYITYTQ